MKIQIQIEAKIRTQIQIQKRCPKVATEFNIDIRWYKFLRDKGTELAFYVSFISGWEPCVDLKTFLHCLDRSKSGANTSLGAVQTSRQSSSFPPTSTTSFLLIFHPASPPISHSKMALEHLGTWVPSGMWKLLYQFVTLYHESLHIFSKDFYAHAGIIDMW